MNLTSMSQNDRGHAGIEFALIASVCVLLFLAVFDLGMGFFRRMQVQSAAQRGAIYATIRGFDVTGMTSVITSGPSSIKSTPAPRQFCGCPSAESIVEVACGSSCSVSGTLVPAGSYVSASAQSIYTPLMKYPALPGTMTFHASQTVRIP